MKEYAVPAGYEIRVYRTTNMIHYPCTRYELLRNGQPIYHADIDDTVQGDAFRSAEKHFYAKAERIMDSMHDAKNAS